MILINTACFVNDMQICDSIDLKGEWELESYLEIKQDKENVYYSNYQTNQENYFPNEIKGQLIINNKDSFSINYEILFKRNATMFDTLEYQDLGEYEPKISCKPERCFGYIDFNNGNSINRDSFSHLCDSTPSMVIWTTIENDSLLMFWRKL